MRYREVLLSALLLGCSSSSSDTGAAAATGGAVGDGGAVGHGGAGGFASGGTAGASSAGGGASGTSGTSGTSAGVGPTVIDCTTAQGFCIAAQATRAGTTFTCLATTLQDTSLSRYLIGTQSWTVRCDDAVSFSVGFPVQDPGPIQLTSAGSSQLAFSVTPTDLSSTAPILDVGSSNLLSGTLVGTLAADLTGTAKLSATWSAPSADCASSSPRNPCAQGSLEMSFHVPLPK